MDDILAPDDLPATPIATVEVIADRAFEHGRYRHPLRFARNRAGMHALLPLASAAGERRLIRAGRSQRRHPLVYQSESLSGHSAGPDGVTFGSCRR
jgi:hypothetical protein